MIKYLWCKLDIAINRFLLRHKFIKMYEFNRDTWRSKKYIEKYLVKKHGRQAKKYGK